MTDQDHAKIVREAGLRVLVCGGRDYDDRDHIWNTLTAIHGERRIALIIHGAATGADSEGMLWADCMPGCKHAPFRADWGTHGKAAGPIRNQRMLDEGKPDLVVAFPGGRGTVYNPDTIKVSHRPTLIILFKNQLMWGKNK